ncbi:hypothetical protein [Paenibacillus sp. URB8-2]|uniref:hypothetical protein n=1 Tax=Paenibacillus sp. URB8-2 TaxID=2741301 RepID=UPI0015BE824A|nr:hypothetical protein [Paenibacillus sp. URB8-2]BCG59135.1 hypothetical protein PUR_25600 [Paenibacillus sp. URB8-2]
MDNYSGHDHTFNHMHMHDTSSSHEVASHHSNDGIGWTDPHVHTHIVSNEHIYSANDPLKYCNGYTFKAMTLDLGDMHFVQPHYVHDYIKADGTVVKGYFRDGDGNTSIDRPLGMGGGYFQNNPGSSDI